MANHRRTDTSEATLLFLERLKQTNPSEAVREAIEQIEDEMTPKGPSRPTEQGRHAQLESAGR